MIGQTLSHFRITAKLGEGGMGEVYQATDTKLNREVALKTLPDAFYLDEQRMGRFTREAQVLASLNHPNIGAIFGLEEEDGKKVLVLELIEGETLGERISRGAIPLEEALAYALSIAEALEAAHEKGVVHRDLKPANVKITPEGKVKVLDFGLAKAMEADPGAQPELSHSPTLTLAATQAGMILGTAGYMAPEQARGRPVDRRADIWAFGVVLFEMLTAQRAFGGETVSDTLAKVLEREPRWNALPAATPEPIRRLLRHCLTKDAKDRLQAIGDARITVQEYLADPEAFETAPATGPSAWRRALPWVFIPLTVLATWALLPSPAPTPAPIVHSHVSLPDGEYLDHQFKHASAISPDGTRIALVSAPDLEDAATRRIWTRRLHQPQLTPVAGTLGAVLPFFSPDGEWLGFYDPKERKLKKVQLAGGSPTTLCETNWPYGAQWTTDGSIVFGAFDGGLLRVSASGGEPESLTVLDLEAHEQSHRLPQVLEERRAILFTALRHINIVVDWTTAQLFALDLETGERKLILDDAGDARYLPTGHLIFAREATVLAAPFDLETLEVTGPPVPVLDAVHRSIGGESPARSSGVAQLAASDSGTLLYALGGTTPTPRRQLVEIDRSGRQTPLPFEPDSLFSLRLSRDGDRFLVTIGMQPVDIWLFDPTRGTRTRQTFEGMNLGAFWLPDGKRFLFASIRDNRQGIFLKAVDSGSEIRQVVSDGWPSSVSPNGQELAFVRFESWFDTDIWIAPLDGSAEPRPLRETRFYEGFPEFSPNGRWLAYASNETGTFEVYVQPYPGPGERVQISSGGGFAPAWSRDGAELFYTRRDGLQHTLSVPITLDEDRLRPGDPEVLFSGDFLGTFPLRLYDVSADGVFLSTLSTPVAEKIEARRRFAPTRLYLVQNWFEELKRLVPVD